MTSAGLWSMEVDGIMSRITDENGDETVTCNDLFSLKCDLCGSEESDNYPETECACDDDETYIGGGAWIWEADRQIAECCWITYGIFFSIRNGICDGCRKKASPV